MQKYSKQGHKLKGWLYCYKSANHSGPMQPWYHYVNGNIQLIRHTLDYTMIIWLTYIYIFFGILFSPFHQSVCLNILCWRHHIEFVLWVNTCRSDWLYSIRSTQWEQRSKSMSRKLLHWMLPPVPCKHEFMHSQSSAHCQASAAHVNSHRSKSWQQQSFSLSRKKIHL